MNTKALRQKILDLAIHGKLVPQDPNDEPASVLLERIRAEKERLIKEGKIKRPKKTKTACDKPHYENEVPFEVPSSWKWCRLGELCVFLSRGKSPKYLDEDRRYPVFAQKCNLKEGGISLAQARFLDPNTINKWDEVYKLKTGDVLVNSTGTGTVGRTRLFNESCLGDYPFVVPDSHVSVIRTVDEIVSEYVYAYMSSNITQEYLEDNLAGSTNQKELYIGVLDDLQIPLPPYNEQKYIVSEIEKWYKSIEVIENGKSDLAETISQTKSKILDLAIHGKLVPQDPTDEPATELLKRINPKAEIACDNAQYGKLPSGWCECSFDDIFNITMGQSPDGHSINHKHGVEFHQGKILFGDKYLIQSDMFTDAPTKLAKPNSLLLCVRAPVGVVNITQREICIGRGLCSLMPNAAINLDYAYHALTTYQSDFESKSTGSTFKAISGNIIRNEILALPPLQEQNRIVAKIKELFAQFDNIASSL